MLSSESKAQVHSLESSKANASLVEQSDSPKILKRLQTLALALLTVPAASEAFGGDPQAKPDFSRELDGHLEASLSVEDTGLKPLFQVRVEASCRMVLGGEIKGTLIQVSKDSFFFKTEKDELQEVPKGEVLSIACSFTSSNPIDQRSKVTLHGAEDAIVTLRDGSIFQISSKEVTGRSFTAYRPWSSKNLEIDEMELRSLQFQSDPLVNAKWKSILHGHNETNDKLVILKNGQLAEVGGIVREITPTHVKFEMEGAQYDVSRGKIYGISFFPGLRKETSNTGYPRVLIGGESFAFKGMVTGQGAPAQIHTLSAGTLELKDADFVLDYTPVNTSALQDMNPSIASWNAVEHLTTPEARRDAVLFGSSSPVVAEEEGLVLGPNTKVDYPLKREYRQFSTSLKVVGEAGGITIYGDGKALFQRASDNGGLDATPIEVALDVSDVRSLVFELRGDITAVFEHPLLIRTLRKN